MKSVCVLILIERLSSYIKYVWCLFSFSLNRSPHGGMANSLYDEKHGIKMGVPTDGCDDGKVVYEILLKSQCKIIVDTYKVGLWFS
jgi:hypothetical protein